MKSQFSYISIIATIFLLALLIWITLPKQQVTQEEVITEAKEIQKRIDTSSIQNIINLYVLQTENLPTDKNVEVGLPQPIDFSKLVTDYMKKQPENTNNYWLDYEGKVSYCPFNPNTYVELQPANGLLAWNLTEGVSKYHIYDLNADKTLLGSSEGTSNFFRLNSINPNSIYALSMIDSAGNECPAVRVN